MSWTLAHRLLIEINAPAWSENARSTCMAALAEIDRLTARVTELEKLDREMAILDACKILNRDHYEGHDSWVALPNGDVSCMPGHRMRAEDALNIAAARRHPMLPTIDDKIMDLYDRLACVEKTASATRCELISQMRKIEDRLQRVALAWCDTASQEEASDD